MRVLVQFIIFSCFRFSVTVVQGQEIRCEAPRDQHLSSPYYFFWGDRKLGAKKYYSCMPGYDKMAAEATCTRDGWTPNPLCAAKQNLCPDLSVENGLIYNNRKEELIYSCNTGYKTFSGNWWDSVTCSEGSWSEEPRCIPVEECGALPSVQHGKLKQVKKTFRHGETTAFECDPGFKPTQSLITCVNGKWETPVCEGVRCGIPPKVENAFITSKPEEFYVDGSSVTYVCQKSFSRNGKSKVSCRNGIWEDPPTCEASTCELESTKFRVKQINPEGKTIFRAGERVEITCAEKYLIFATKESIKSFTCQDDGQWDHEPVCVGKCGPPPNVEFADTTEMQKNEYDSKERVEYMCFNKYTLDQRYPNSKYLTCERGEWTGNIKCLKPCTVTVDEMDERGIELQWGGRQKIFSPHKDRISFACQWGKYLRVNELMQTCNDGEMILPVCV